MFGVGLGDLCVTTLHELHEGLGRRSWAAHVSMHGWFLAMYTVLNHSHPLNMPIIARFVTRLLRPRHKGPTITSLVTMSRIHSYSSLPHT